MGPSSAPTQEPSPMAAPPPGQYVSSYSSAYTNPFIFIEAPYISPYFSTSTSMLGFIFEPLSPAYYTTVPSTFPMMTMPMMVYSPSTIWALTESPTVMPSMHGTQYSYTLTSMVPQTPPRSLFYQSGSSDSRIATDRNQPRMKVKKMRGRDHNLHR
ncbi:hypothetical protein Gotri_011012, partial [Gossypium trilobum]|nr:hypothetical protein [Gossypium trilobum]